MSAQWTRNAIVVAALLAAGFFAAWLRFRDHLGVSGVYSDGAHEWRPVRAGGELRYAVWGAPHELAALNGTGDESRPALSPDGRLIVFAVGERGLNADLFAADVLGDERYGPPRALSGVNGPRDELAPAFADGFLYFASDREGGAGGLDLWRAPFAAGAFGAPERLSGGINTAADETDPAPRGAGSTLVFASDRAGSFDLYQAAPDPERATPVPTGGSALGGGAWVVRELAALSSPFDEREPAFGDDARTLFFASDRPGAGSFDLYKSARHGTEWLAPLPMEGVNGPASERGPLPSADGFALLYSRAEEGRPADLYRVRSIELYRLPGRPVGWLDLVLLLALVLLALLAWLARRWPGLDILWKCLFVSLLVHLALVWLLRYLYVEPEPYDLPGDDRRIRVRLLEDSSRLAALRERGGALEVERRSAEGERLERRSFELARSEGDEPRPGAAPSLDERQSDLWLEPGPERASEAATEAPAPRPRASAERLASTALHDALPAAEKESAAAPVLALAVDRTSLERGPSEAALPTRPRATRTTTMAPMGPSAAAGATAPVLSAASFAFLPALPPAGESAGPLVRPELSAEPAFRAAPPPVVLRDAVTVSPAVPPASEAPQAAAPALDLTASLLDARGLDRLPSAAEPTGGVADGAGPRRWSAAAGGLPDARPEARSVPVAAREATAEEGPAARWAETPYQARGGALKERALEQYGGTEETERAVRDGLAYLARVQHASGCWGSAAARDDKYGQIAVGKTGLCLLAFLGAGHTHRSGTEHSDTVRRALAFLLAVQDRRGGHFGEGSAYGHGIATYAVAECYALTQDPALREALEPAVDQILRHQNRRPDRRTFGGWSYYYATDRVFDEWPRVSISVWQVMALESARLGGLPVPDVAFEDAREFLVNSRDPSEAWFRYNHDPDRLRSGYPTLPASTPAALFALSLLGEDVDGAAYARARAFVVDRAPDGYRFTTDDDFVHRAQGNLYFWYYGTLATFRIGGGAWRTWNEAMQATLVPAQQADGSWRPIDIYALRFAGDTDRDGGAGAGDRSYSTSLAVLSLEVYYRYYLPLLKVR